jgi:hypothetical protein
VHKHRFGVPMRCHKRVYVRLARPLRRARRAEMKCRCQTGAASERTTASRSLIADHGANWGRELRALWRRSFGRRAARHDEGEIPAGHFKFLRVWSVKFLHPRGRTRDC